MEAPDRGAASSTFGALQHREFRLFLSGLASAHVGRWMQEFALGWLVVQLAIRDGNPALGGVYLGLRSVANAAPGLVFGLLAGPLADRMDRRDLLVRARIAYSVPAILLAALVATDHVNIVVVMIFSAILTAAHAFDPPVRLAMVPRVVPARDLYSGLGLTRLVTQATQGIGPFIGGLLIAPIGIGGVMLANAACALASLGGLLPMQPLPPKPNARTTDMLQSLREGLGYVRRDDLMRESLILHVVFVTLTNSLVQLLPAVAVYSLGVGAIELSWMVAAAGAGALVGALMVATAGMVGRPGLLMLGSLGSCGALLALLGVQRHLVLTLVILAANGVTQQLFMGTQTAILQLASPDRLRGRIMGMQSLIYATSGPVGVLALGTLGTFIGISTAILLGGIVVVAVAVLGLRIGMVRDLYGSDPRLAGHETEPTDRPNGTG